VIYPICQNGIQASSRDGACTCCIQLWRKMNCCCNSRSESLSITSRGNCQHDDDDDVALALIVCHQWWWWRTLSSIKLPCHCAAWCIMTLSSSQDTPSFKLIRTFRRVHVFEPNFSLPKWSPYTSTAFRPPVKHHGHFVPPSRSSGSFNYSYPSLCLLVKWNLILLKRKRRRNTTHAGWQAPGLRP